ncbi:14779_t:CDS:10 [Funneliformis geosporum]|nr:14779_t:CDS:10 [Funneliformis geosporum]
MNSQERASNSKISGLQFLKADPKMRYLVEAIEKNRGASRMMDEEIVSTLTEIRSLGSKYADPNLVGRAELYEAIESVLNALKAYSEYSLPFLKKVSSKEAPDYNKIIKRPMDLNQDNYYRKCANAMKIKTDELLKNVPDIVIKTREKYNEEMKKKAEEEMMKKTAADAAAIVAQVHQEIAAEEKPEMNQQPYLIQEQASTDALQDPVTCSGEINDDECDRELQEMLKGLDVPLSWWDPEIDNPDRGRLFDPEYWKEQETKRPTLDQYPQLQFSNRGTAAMIEHNIETLKQTRLLHAKLLAAKHNLPLSHFGVNETAPSEKVTNCRTQIDPNSSPPLVMNREAGFACMQRVVSLTIDDYIFSLCVGGSSMAVNILTEVAQDYLLSLGKTMRAYRDDVFNKKSPEEIIKKTLYENGATSFKDLESYVRDDIVRYGSKLKEIQRRLVNAYKDSLIQPDNTEAEEDLPENDDVFITGNLGEGIELGDDFFGLKELGLGNLSVPTRLLLGSNKIKPAQKKTPEQNQRKSRYTPPPPFAPIDPDKQIGLLTEYFRNRLEDQSGKLIDDEFLPPKQRNQRPKVPPTGKIPPQPKRQPPKTAAQNAAALAEKKRKRERDAAIAEEKEKAKRIRLEERLKAQQEREEQKRIKQEQREAKKKAEAEEKRLKKLQAEAEKKAEREKRTAEAAAQRAEARKIAEKKESKKKKPTTSKMNRAPATSSSQQVRGGSASSTMAGSSSASKKILDQIDDSDSEDVPLAVRKKTRTKEAAISNARGGNGRGNSRPPNIN